MVHGIDVMSQPDMLKVLKLVDEPAGVLVLLPFLRLSVDTQCHLFYGIGRRRDCQSSLLALYRDTGGTCRVFGTDADSHGSGVLHDEDAGSVDAIEAAVGIVLALRRFAKQSYYGIEVVDTEVVECSSTKFGIEGRSYVTAEVSVVSAGVLGIVGLDDTYRPNTWQQFFSKLEVGQM